MRGFLSRLRREDGVAALEFAIVSQLLFLLLYGILMYGFVFGIDHNITQAAAEGARYAISEPDGTAASTIQSDAVQAAKNHLSFSMVKANASVTAAVANCPAPASSISCVTVTISYNYRSYPIIPAFLGLQNLAPSTISSTSTVELD